MIDCQTSLLDHMESRFVVPLLPRESAPPIARQLNPMIDDRPHVMLTQSAAAIRRRDLGPRVASLVDHDREIMNALDFLLTGA